MKTRILRIRVRNLASLEGEHVVELEHGPLADAGIFPIVGPTGAGKSTLLDAICLALFARLPRLPAATKGARSDEGLSPSDPRHALRRGAGEGLAEVEFLGRDGRRYRATWSVQRAHKRPDRPLQNAKHVFFDVARDRAVGDGKSETKSLIEARLGLGYEELVRSMLLPQGEFAALLRSKPDERAKLLEKLTRTTIYARISELAGARRSEAKRAVEQLDAKLGEVRALDPDTRLALETRALDAERVLGELRALAEASHAAELRLAELRRREAELFDAAAELESARRTSAEQAALRAEVERAERCQPARVAHEALATATARSEQSKARRATAEAALVDAREKLEGAIASAETTLAELQRVNAHRERLREPLLRAKQLDSELHERTRELARLGAECDEATRTRVAREQALGATTEQHDVLTQRRSELVRELANDAVGDELVARWPGIEASFRIVRTLRDDVSTRERSIAAHEGELDAFRAAMPADDDQQGRLNAHVETTRQKLDELARALDERERAWSAAAQERLRARENTLQRLQEAELALEAARTARRARSSERSLHADAFVMAQSDRDQARADLAAVETDHENAERAVAEAQRAHLALTLRAELRPGEPCPVCGGCDHVEAHPSPPDVARAQEALQVLDQTVRRARTHLTKCEGRAAATEAEHEASLRAESDAAAHVTQQLERVEALRALAELDARDGVKDALATVTSALAEGAAALHRIDALRDERRRTSEELERAHEAARALDMRCRERDLACERLRGGLESSRVELRDAEERARAAHATLERELGRPLHDALEAELRSAVESRRARRERLLGIEKRSAELQSQVEQERVRLRDAREREAKLVEAIERARGEMTTRRDERASLLEGRPAEAVEAELERARDEATNAHEQAAQRAAAAQARHAADRETLDVRIAEACDAEREANDAHERWNQAIRDAELDADTVVAALVAWPSDRVASARRELDRTHDRLTRATTLHERASRSLAEHRADCPADLVEQAERRIYCDQAATRAAEVHGQYAGELAADDTRRHRSAALLSERENAVARLDLLEQLVALVGSGQGASNHLSRFAQGLTLEVLVDAANTQLERLAPRYRLRRVATSELDLELVDRDLADESRPVHGLSGGETFLVSLALALGLATLAGDDLDLGSLFVDEGFGSLDPETLETALAALEAIHAEGVQVALITHVEGLADRFAASVHVRRVGPGRSVVEVRS